MAASRAEQLLVAALNSQDLPPNPSEEKEYRTMNNNTNTANTAANNDEAVRAEADALAQARANERNSLEETLQRATKRLEELRKEEAVDNNRPLADAESGSWMGTAARVVGYTAAAVGVAAAGIWAYGRFSGRSAGEVVDAATAAAVGAAEGAAAAV